jgi:hypothetical protein
MPEEKQDRAVETETNQIAHYLRFFLRGQEDPLVFRVSGEEVARFRLNIADWDGKKATFFSGSSLDGEDFAINFLHMRLANILWDPAWHIRSAKTDTDESIRLWFSDGAKRYDFLTEDYAPLAQVFFNLDLEATEDDPLQVCIDEDGEEVVINVMLLAAIVAPTEWVKLGNDEIDDEQSGSDA